MLEWYYLVLISSGLSGIATLVEKSALRKEYATEFSSTIAPLIALFSLVFIPLANFNISLWQLLLIAMWSLVNAYSFLLAARSFRHSEVSASSAAFGSLPTLVVVVFAFIFLSEHLGLLQYIGIIGMVITIYLLFFRATRDREGKHAFDSSKYKYIVLFAVFISGISSVFNKYAISGVNPYTFLILSSIFMSAFFAIDISIRYKGVREIIQTARTYRLPLSVNAVLAVGYRLSYYLALVTVPVSLAQPLSNALYVIITVAIGGMLFKEGGVGRKLMLSVLLILFAYLLTLNT